MSEGTKGAESLTAAIEELARPYETVDDLASTELKLDVVASELLRTEYAQQKLGEARIEELGSPFVTEAPVVLREVGGPTFEPVAQLAANLIELLTPSVSDLGSAELANAERQRSDLYRGLCALLAEIRRGP